MSLNFYNFWGQHTETIINVFNALGFIGFVLCVMAIPFPNAEDEDERRYECWLRSRPYKVSIWFRIGTGFCTSGMTCIAIFVLQLFAIALTQVYLIIAHVISVLGG